MALYALGDLAPVIHPGAFIHPEATVIGDVHVEEGANIWAQAVLRGDFGRIEVRANSCVQDGTVVHAGPNLPTIIGPNALVGHLAHLEGCVLEPWSLVGSMAVVLHRSVVRTDAVVGANALVLNDIDVPARSMALGVPCRIYPDRVRPGANARSVELYVRNGERYRRLLRLMPQPVEVSQR